LLKATRKAILVLEGEPLVMTVFHQVLRSAGFDVHPATSAKEALEKFTHLRSRIDLLIADVAIPGSSGLHVALACCLISPKLRIIITSGAPSSTWTETETRQFDALPAGRVALLPKPFSPDQLLESVHRISELPEDA